MHLPTWVILGTLIPIFALGYFYGRRAHALGRAMLIAFVVSGVYGLAVEAYANRTTEAYSYANLWLMYGTSPDWVPYCIGVTWAMVIFIVMQTSDRLGLPVVMRPLVDAAMAVSLDLVIDPVSSASRWVADYGVACLNDPTPTFGGFGLWVWCVPNGYRTLWFTIPLGNFLGWFAVVFGISTTLRLALAWLKQRQASAGLEALLLSVAGMLAFGFVKAVVPLLNHNRLGHSGQAMLLGALLVIPLGYVLIGFRSWKTDHPFDYKFLLLPFFVWGGGVGGFVLKGIDRDTWPQSLVQLIAVALMGAGFYLLPYAQRLMRRSTSA